MRSLLSPSPTPTTILLLFLLLLLLPAQTITHPSSTRPPPPTANLTLYPHPSCAPPAPSTPELKLYAHANLCTSFAYPPINSFIINGILNVPATDKKKVTKQAAKRDVLGGGGGGGCILKVYAEVGCKGLLADGGEEVGKCVAPVEILGGREVGVASVRLVCA
ncbi:MAG: hypothetical protein M1836_002760 [Candelina mexicana]|nr:MAG: hypothetical protein M1836_002760 [Candelina mexicana]